MLTRKPQSRGIAIFAITLATASSAIRVHAASPVTAGSSGAASAPSSQRVWAENDRARECFRLGINAMRAGRFEEAQQLLSEAWQLRQTYDVAASLAQVENELGNYPRAASLLDFCMTHFAPIESDKNFAQLSKAFDDVRHKVGFVDLSGVPSGTEMLVDGTTIGTLPLALPCYLEPGSHELEFRLGQLTTREWVLINRGAQHRVAPQFKTPRRSSGISRPRPAPAVSAEASAAERPTFPYYIGAALFITGVTGATAYGVMEHNARVRYDQLRAQLGTAGCYSGVSSGCGELAEARADRSYARSMKTFSAGLAATALVATGLYWVWPEKSTPAAKVGSAFVVRPDLDLSHSLSRIGASGTLSF
jgi:hypothetical protein